MLTADRLKQLLHYNPETGVFTWLVHRYSVRAGAVAGGYSNKGYLQIKVDGRLYKAHRLAWLYMTGEWPADQIDHVNLDRGDNSFANLREATNAENQRNSRAYKSNKSGVRGVFWHRGTGKWRAQIRVNNRKISLGLFTDINEAAAAYAAASAQYHGEFGRAA